MRNSQLAALSAIILIAALIVGGTNLLVYRGISQLAGAGGGGGQQKKLTIAVMPKSKGNAYFIACQRGAQEAAKELGVDFIWDGPTDPDPARQNVIVENWVNQGVDAIAVACENGQALSPALVKAREKGVRVVTFDADARPDARSFFVNQASGEGIGDALMDNAARVMGGKGELALICATLTAENQIQWREAIERRRKEKYPDIRIVTTEPCDDKQDVAFAKCKSILNANAGNKEFKLIMAICSPAVPGAAEAVSQSTRPDVKVVGLGLPSDNKKWVHAGITDCVILWKTQDLGYLAVYAADAVARGKLKPGDKSIQAGRLGGVDIQGDNILLGKPFVFNKDNIDQFDF